MNFTINIESYTLNKNPNFIRLIERIRQCIHEREKMKEQQQRQIKIYSTIHYIEHIKRYINDNPLIGRVLLRFNDIIKKFSLQNNRFSSTITFDNNSSKISLDEKFSIDNLRRIHSAIDSKLDLSKTNLINSKSTMLNNLQSTKSTTHYIRSTGASRQSDGLMTKSTLAAINKTPRQRTTDDIEVLEHLINHCESLRYLSADVRHYIARSLLFFTYHPNTILTRQNFPPFLIYIIVYGQCKLLLETNQTIIYGHQLNIGDIYGDDSLQSLTDYHLNGLITNEINHCNLIGFFSRDIRAYENYLSDMMKQLLLEQFRIQSTFIAIQWRNDILDYFLKYSNYKQYKIDEIIYGNEEYEHNNLYFILHGEISFICLLDFPSIIIKHPELNDYYYNIKKNQLNFNVNQKIEWRFIEIFNLTNGHYFGFETNTIHSWYITRSIVDIISIPKIRFKELGYFAPMIFEKLRQDFLNIYPNKTFIRNSYIKYLQLNQSNENDNLIIKYNNQKKRTIINNHVEKFNLIPEQNVLNQYKEKLRLSNKYSCY